MELKKIFRFFLKLFIITVSTTRVQSSYQPVWGQQPGQPYQPSAPPGVGSLQRAEVRGGAMSKVTVLIQVHLIHHQLTVPGPGQEDGPPAPLHAQPYHQDLRVGGQLVQVDGWLSLGAGPGAHVVHQQFSLVSEVQSHKPEWEVWDTVQLHVAIFATSQ
jgi:hypothetical protein